MTTPALIFPKPRTITQGQVTLPDTLESDQVRLETWCSGVSIGTERLLWEDRLAYAEFPQVLGYQAVGRVTEVGDEVDDLSPGDTVVWRSGVFAEDESTAPVSGCHAAAAVAPRGEVTPAPEGIDPHQAALYVLPAVGFHGVAMAGVSYTDLVAVQGLGLVGLSVVAACRLRGARIVALDPSAGRREAARQMGADHLIDPTDGDALEAVQAIQEAGADVVFEATGFGKLLDDAFALARRHGKFVFQGNYGADAPIAFDFIPPHGKQLHAFFPCNDGLQPCRRAVLQLMASGQLDFRPAVSHIVSPQEAVGLYEGVIAGEGAATEALGIVIDWR